MDWSGPSGCPALWSGGSAVGLRKWSNCSSLINISVFIFYFIFIYDNDKEFFVGWLVDMWLMDVKLWLARSWQARRLPEETGSERKNGAAPLASWLICPSLSLGVLKVSRWTENHHRTVVCVEKSGFSGAGTSSFEPGPWRKKCIS